MKCAGVSASAVGPERTSTTVGFPPPFALSLSKGQAELAEALVPRDKGFDRLSPNGDKAGLRYLSPNGSLRTVNFRNGPIADGDERAGFSSAPPGTTLRQRKGFCLLRYGRTWLKKTGLP